MGPLLVRPIAVPLHFAEESLTAVLDFYPSFHQFVYLERQGVFM